MILGWVVLFATASGVHAERLRRVGVVVTLAVNAPRAEKLASRLGDALREALVVDVIAGADAARRLPASGVPNACVSEPKCIDDVARRLDADELLMLSVVRVGDHIQIDSTWVDVATKHAVSRPAMEISVGKEDPATILAAAAPELLPDAPRRADAAAGTTDPSGPAQGGDPVPLPEAPVATGGHHITTGMWITGGVAVAAVAGGVGFGLVARNRYHDLEGCPGGCTDSDLDGLRRVDLTADLLFGTAIVCATTTVVLYYLSDADEPSVAAAPAVTADGVGMAVGGVF